MRVFIDTNVFVYATYPQFPQHIACRDFLKECLTGSDAWYLSWGVIYEYLRVVTHPKLFGGEGLSFSGALENVLLFLSSSHVEILQETAEHVRTLQALEFEYQPLGGNILHDAHNVCLMREHNLSKIATVDTDFHRFKGIKVVNPL